MSWKSFFTASLLCVLASPAFANPQLEIVFGGIDATTGGFVWNVRVAPTAVGTPMDVELGIAETGTRNLVSVVNNATSTVVAGSNVVWDTNVAGNAPPTWLAGVPTTGWVTPFGSPLKPEGLYINCSGCTAASVDSLATVGQTAPNTGENFVNGTLDQIYAALGSRDLIAADLTSPAGTTIAASSQLLRIIVQRPIAGASSSSLALLGAYDGNTSGHISEITSPATNSSNYKNFSGPATRTLIAGDADLSNGTLGLDPAVTGADLVLLAQNIGVVTGKVWTQGDFDGDGQVTGADLVILAQNIGQSDAAHIGLTSNLTRTGALDTPGAGSGLGAGSTTVPEPASIALLALALLGGLGLAGRRR